MAVKEKSNEIKAIPEVLDSLDITGAVITIDAMGTQTDIARRIIDAERDYAPVNLNVLRKLALGIVKAEKDKHSVKKRMFKAAMNPEYLKKLLRI